MLNIGFIGKFNRSVLEMQELFAINIMIWLKESMISHGNCRK